MVRHFGNPVRARDRFVSLPVYQRLSIHLSYDGAKVCAPDPSPFHSLLDFKFIFCWDFLAAAAFAEENRQWTILMSAPIT